jgi:hypothetical protein
MDVKLPSFQTKNGRILRTVENNRWEWYFLLRS